LPEVTGHSLPQDAAWFSKYSPLRNVDAAFPPTVLVHGRDDSDVPATESDELAARLQDARVVHEYYPLPGIGHGFAGASPELVETVETSVVNFLFAHVAQ
jgi:dipeptidyl aminopeptidase/acylaminoacyl peptidase